MLRLAITRDKNRWVSKLIRINWLIALLYYLAVPILHRSSVTQALTAVGCIVSTLIWIVALQHINVSRIDLTLVIFCALILLMKAIVGRSYTIVDGWYSVLAFVNVLGFFLIFRDIRLTEEDFDFIYYISVFLILLFFIYSFTGIAYRMEVGGKTRYVKALVLNLNNANAAAMHLYGLFCIILINIQRRRLRAFNIALCVIALYLMIRTECRSCILAVIFVAVYYLFFRRKVLPKAIILIAMLLPIISLVLYLAVYFSGSVSVVTFANKMFFSGRETIYIQVLSELKSAFTVLFGAVRKEYFFNAHNAMLSVLSSIGVLGTISYFILLVRRVFDIREISPISTACIIGLSIQACAESAMFTGFFPFNMFMMLFFVLGGYEEYDAYAPAEEY